MSDSDKSSSAVLVSVAGILLDPTTQAPVVILQTEDTKQQLPIWIGMAEATSIAASLKKLSLNRPLTHDLFINILEELDASIEQAMITDLKDSTYFAELVLSAGERAVILDCRPSDAIAVALRNNAPIYVSSKVLNDAQNDIAIQKLKSPSIQGGKAEKPEEEEEEQNPKIKDLRYVDKSKWADILKELDAEDFKYKV